MTPRTIFQDALEFSDPADRYSFLDRVCGSDTELRERVEALLTAHAAAGPDFLDGPEVQQDQREALLPTGPHVSETAGGPHGAPLPNDRFSSVSSAVAVGTIIAGRYKLLEPLGEGGMGDVWLAEQSEPIRRKVALKLIRSGLDSRAVLARFEAERQALALMDHPNIAKVLDAGAADDGRPFFVMELVKGKPITEFCDARKYTPRQRLELIVPVCQAIQHAHQKGIIHRDIKPSNVLVAMYDERPVPKVIDFGVAKATGSPLTEKTLHTGFEAVVGTPAYMSPEQATFNQLDIDTRSDVYSLGVLLYELLTGTTPVEKARFRNAAMLEMLRVVREEDAPRPSSRLSTTETREIIAATRGMDPTSLSKMFRGELDWIAMKALEKDRNRRYETANGLARDVERYLADEMVEARPPSVGYRAKKFFRKHRGPVFAASLVLLAIIGGVAATVSQFGRAERAELREKMQESEVEGARLRQEATQREAALLRESMLHNAGVAQYAIASSSIIDSQNDPILREKVERGLRNAIESLEMANAEFPGNTGHVYFLGLSYLSLARLRLETQQPKKIEEGLGYVNRAEQLFVEIRNADPHLGLLPFASTLTTGLRDDIFSLPIPYIGLYRYTAYLFLKRYSEALFELDRIRPDVASATPPIPPGGDVVLPEFAAAVLKIAKIVQQNNLTKVSEEDLLFFRNFTLRAAEMEQSRLPWSRGPKLDQEKAMRLAEHLANSRGVAEPAVYNAACVFALASADPQIDNAEHERRATKAVTYLDRICQAGYFRHTIMGNKRRSEIANDHDLDSLRGRSDFQKVLARSQIIPPALAPPPRVVNR